MQFARNEKLMLKNTVPLSLHAKFLFCLLAIMCTLYLINTVISRGLGLVMSGFSTSLMILNDSWHSLGKILMAVEGCCICFFAGIL